LIQSHVIPAINSRGSHRGISTLEEIVVDTKLRDAKGENAKKPLSPPTRRTSRAVARASTKAEIVSPGEGAVTPI
jgi:hypothetical protein